jgi:hypothetical protein
MAQQMPGIERERERERSKQRSLDSGARTLADLRGDEESDRGEEDA